MLTLLLSELGSRLRSIHNRIKFPNIIKMKGFLPLSLKKKKRKKD